MCRGATSRRRGGPIFPGVWSEPLHHGPKVSKPPAGEGVDALIARIAAPQHGVVTHAQLIAAGLGEKAIRYRVRIGRLHRLHRGVYAVGHCPPSPHARAMAAVLACGPGAALSHRSAAALWNMRRPWRGPVEVSGPGRHRHAGIRHYRCKLLDADRDQNYGIPVTTPARTIVDFADVEPSDRALTRALNEARLNKHLTLPALTAQLARSNGRRGAHRLRQHTEYAGAPTRSEFEDAARAFVEQYDLGHPETNQVIEGYEVDLVWRDAKLIVELDSRTHHDTAIAFEQDRERDATLLAAGYVTVRVTWRRLIDAPAREAERLRALIQARTDQFGAASASGP